jgi:predicted GTPase
MHTASQVLAAGPDFRLIGPDATMLESKVPVVSVCAVRTGSGKSQTTRRVVQVLRDKGRKVVAVRHPMPYGDLARQRVQRFAALEDLDRHRCTIEEREEYEPHIAAGCVVYAGIDYGAILAEAEKEA